TANSGNANSLRVTTYNTYNDYPFLQFGTFLTNHDMNRVIEVLGQDRNKARIAASLYLTLPGVPYVYYGEEIGMRGEKPDQNIRRPMQWSDANFGGFSTGGNWTALNSNFTCVNAASQSNDPTSLLHHYRELIHIRNQEVTLRRGTYHDCYTPRLQVMSFVRQLDKEAVLVLVNLQGVAAPAFSIDVASTDLAIADHVVQNLMDGTFTTIQVGMDQRIDDLELAPWETRIYKIQDVTGADEIANPSTVGVFPNPFTGTVQLKGLPAGQAFHFELSDLHGRMLQHGNQQIATAATVLEFPELSPGVYLLTVHTNNQQHTLKVIHR
ncbi:MAG: alpha-amylase family glycosyl hydrolase, partial [Salibacteraceae bacterium]